MERRSFLRALPLLPFSTALSSSLFAQLAAPLERSPESRVPFLERTRIEPGTPFGSGLEGRLAFDSRRLVEEGLIVANDDFFIRTRAPDGVKERQSQSDDWKVQFTTGEDASGHQLDFGGPYSEVSVGSLRERSRAMGPHLLECSGNSSRHRFGLLSVAEWSGVLLSELFAEYLGNIGSKTRVLVKGNDDHSTAGRGSRRGASWIFTVDQIKAAGGFLATGMNGEPLPLDHGNPVRLVMPGWYGCTCIKWVESIEVVRDDRDATSQMLEYASRTHQSGQPPLARDFEPAEIDFTAMPILAEGPDPDGAYLLTGVAWGNPSGVRSLLVRYQEVDEPREALWLEVEGFEAPPRSSWVLWRHRFRPPRSAEYEVTLRIGESRVRTRRLDHGHYARRLRL